MTLVLATAVRVSVVLLVSLFGAALLRRRSAAARHWVLAMGLVAAAAMPLLQVLTPQWGMHRPAIQALVGTAVATVPSTAPGWVNVTEVASSVAIAQWQPSLALVAAWAWLAGVLIAMLLLCAGFVRLAWVAARCEPVIERRWTAPLHQLTARPGVRRDVTLLQSDHPTLLVTYGLWRPAIILPVAARDWADDRIRIVLCHELSHVRRSDWALQMLGSVLRAIYWFNPLVWIACHWLRHESERACDDDVLRLGLDGSAYATELLNIARTLRPPAWSPAPGMARPSSLQRRVRAMLNTTIDRSPLSPVLRAAIAAGVLCVAVALAGASAAAQAIGSAVSGSFVDVLNNAIPNVTLTLISNATGERYGVRSDADGRFTFDALPDGDYRGEVNAIGFTSIHPFFRIKDGRSTQPTVIPLPLGSIEETVTVTSAPVSAISTAPGARNEQARVQAFRQRDPNATIAPPLKLRDVRPIYPPNRTDDEATIFLAGFIDTSGLMKGLQVMQPADSDFARSALDAVNNWQFEPTRLHGVAVDTSIHVTVRFVH